MKVLEISYCTCESCKNMCRKVPCTPTPQDVRRLIEAGYKDKLEVLMPFDRKKGFYWVIVKPKRQGGHEFGPCAFFNKDGLCDLHDAGLKPTEGKFAIHGNYDTGLFESVALSWVSKEGIEIIKELGAPTTIVELLQTYLKTRQEIHDITVFDEL